MSTSESFAERKKKAVLAIATAVIHHHDSLASSVSAVAAVAASQQTDTVVRAVQGRYRRLVVGQSKDSFWYRVRHHGDDLEFLHFTAFSREAINELVELTQQSIISSSIDPRQGVLREQDIQRRRFDAYDILVMAVKWLTCCSEVKNLHCQFGALATQFENCVYLGLGSILKALVNNEKARVFWDMSEDNLQEQASLTAAFEAIRYVIAMMDGLKLVTLNDPDPKKQNRDYNGWTGDTNRNCIFVWSPSGKVIDCVVNAPGNFHDSKSCYWGNIYDHIKKLPDPYLAVCDSAFKTSGDMSGKLVKLKEGNENTMDKSEYERSLTHLRQASEWGNGCLTKVFRRVVSKLPTCQMRRELILWCSVLLLNFRTETMDRNQIRTYFNYVRENYQEEQQQQSTAAQEEGQANDHDWNDDEEYSDDDDYDEIND